MSRGPSGFGATCMLAVALLFACGTASPVLASNPYFNVPISTAPGAQRVPQVVPDGTGGAIIVWWTESGGILDDIYAQRVDASGAPQWTANGVPVVSSSQIETTFGIVSDGAGGVIVTWPQYTGPTTLEVRAQRLNAAGAQQWGAGGVTVGATGNYPAIASDGLGGAILFWRDSRVADEIYAQRIDATGTSQWTANGVAVCTAAGTKINPRVVADGSSGAIASWIDYRGANPNVYVQRMDATGTPLWTADGVAVGAPTAIQYVQEMTSDGAGGTIVTWQDGFTFFGSGVQDVYAQRVDATGTPQWTASGIALCTAPNAQSVPVIAPDGTGGAVIGWLDYRTLRGDLYAQRVNATGVPQWPVNGVPICAGVGDVVSATIVPDGTGGSLLGWSVNRPLFSGFQNLYAQRVDASGTPQWTLNGSPVSIARGLQGNARMLADGAGGALVAWQDTRACEFCEDIYAQQIDPSGATVNGPPETFGSIAGQIKASCPTIGTPLLGVTVDAFSAGTGDLLATGTTDASGNYTIPGVLAIHYIMSVVTPLGYNTPLDATVKVNDGQIAGFNATNITCVTATGNPASANFWKHQIGIATGGNGNAKVDGPTICSYLDLIESHFNNNALNQVVVYTPPPASTCAQKLDLAKALLNFGNSAAPLDKARQQLTALLLNVAANNLGLIDVISKDGATVSQAITYCDQLIDNPTGDHDLAKTIADKINGGQTLSAGLIPLSTAQIAYRAELALRTFRAKSQSGGQSFSFTMGRAGSVRLRLYDVAGRLVSRVVDGEFGEGAHVVRWNGTTAGGNRAGNGLYFARLETSGGARTLKVLQLAR